MFSLHGTSDTPGAYSVHITASPDEYRKRKKPMFMPGTVHYATEQANLAELDKLIKEGKANLGFPESVTLQQKEELLGMMPVHIAAERGHLEVMQYLIKKHVDLDAGDKFRVTAMHLAAIENHVNIVKLLISCKADPKQPDCEGDTALHWAATRGHCEVIQLLVAAGTAVDAANKQGWTALHRAAYNGRRAACQLLVNLGASLSHTNKHGNTALHLATFMNQLSTMETLLGLAARTDLLNAKGEDPMSLAITEAAREIIQKNITLANSTQQITEQEGTRRAVDAGLAEDIQRLSSRPADKDAALGQALRAKAKAAQDFPDMDKKSAAAAVEGEEAAESSLYMRSSSYRPAPGVSDFLHEASQAFDDRASPYALMGYQNTTEERTSRTSSQSFADRRTSRTSAVGAGSLVQRTSALNVSGVDVKRQTSLSHGGAGITARQEGAPGDSHRPPGLARSPSKPTAAPGIAPRPSGAAGSPAKVSNSGSRVERDGAGSLKPKLSTSTGFGFGWEGTERLTADEYQQKVRDDNRRAAAAAGSAALLGEKSGGVGAVAGGGATQALQRSNSNKKFLEKYHLDKLNLFAPS